MARGYFDQNFIPIGALASLLIIFIYAPKFLFEKEIQKSLIILTLFAIFSVISIINSKHNDLTWLIQFYWYAVNLTLGVAIIRYHDFENKKTRTNNFLFFSIALLSTIFFLDYEQGSKLDFNYLRIASGVFLSFLFFFFYFRHNTLKLATYIAGAIILWNIGSRSWFYMWATTIIVFFIAKTGWSTKSLKLAFFTILSLFAITKLIEENLPSDLADSRILQLILNPESDTSLIARNELLEQGIAQIEKNWFLGYYNGFLEYSSSGGYIHNILSFWHQYGLIPFLIYSTSLITAVIYTLTIKETSNRIIFVKILVLLIFIQSIFSMAYVSSIGFLAIGCALGLHWFRKGPQA